jgi:NitT/TauT family transport system permease protein
VGDTPVALRVLRRIGNALRSPGGLGTIALLVVLIGWQVLGSNVDPLLFASPLRTLRAVPRVVQDGLIGDYVSTIVLFLVSLAGSFVLGIIAGLVTGLARYARYALQPIVVILYSTPGIALIPLFIIWLGIGVLPNVALVFLSAFFPAMINVQSGVNQVSGGLLEMGKSFGARQHELVTRIVLPAIVPNIMAGLRIATPRAFVALIAAQMLITSQGLGGMVLTYGNALQTDRYLVPVVMIVVTSLLLAGVISLVEKRLSRWRPRPV